MSGVVSPRTPADLVARLRAAPETAALGLTVAGAVVLLLLTGQADTIGPVALLGVAAGAPVAVQAIGIVLVYRANRIINFSQVALGSLSGVLFYELWAQSAFIRLWGGVCQCVGDDPKYAPYWMQSGNFILSVVVALVIAPAVGALVYVALIRPLERAPALVLTILTVAVAYLVIAADAFAVTKIQGLLGDANSAPGAGTLPVDIVLRVSTVVLHLPDLLATLVAVGAATGVGLFLRRTWRGTVVRATADDPTRATTLGISVIASRAMVWAIAASLSAVVAVLAAFRAAPTYTSGDIGSTQLVVLLAVVVIARLRSVGVAVAAAFALGFLQQAMATGLRSQTVFLAVLLPIICAFLLLQRGRGTRAESELASTWQATAETRSIPRELLALGVVRRGRAALVVLLVAVLVGLPWVISPGDVTLASQSLILGIVALSVLVLSGWAGQISLGQLAVAAIGSFLTSVLAANHGVPWPLAVVAGGLVASAVATVVGIPALRLPGLYLAVVTLALSLTVTEVLLSPDLLGGQLPDSLPRPVIFGLSSSQEQVFYYLSLGAVALTTFSVARIRQSRTARALIAARDNERAARTLGINVVRARLIAFALAGFLAGIAGGLYAFAQGGTSASSYGVAASLSIFLITIIGGLGSVFGPLVGVAFYFLVELLIPSYAQFAIGGGLVLLFLVFPGGIGGALYAARDAMLRRVAVRNNVSVPSLLGEGGADARRRARIAPKLRPGTTLPDFVPAEYRVREQWSVASAPSTLADHG